jgi:hypothetical protein
MLLQNRISANRARRVIATLTAVSRTKAPVYAIFLLKYRA